MHVRIKLIALTMGHAQLQLMLPCEETGLPSEDLTKGNPDSIASELASELSGYSEGVQRHGFLSPDDTDTDSLTLIYIQLVTEEKLQGNQAAGMALVPVADVGRVLSTVETRIVNEVVGSLKADLDQVMQSRLNKRGLIHLLGLLPDIFDHKELAAAYYALTGEKPSSPLMLARMMLDRYTMGSGDRQREVKGRDLIEEYEPEAPDLLGEKWAKNKELYRTGGPKAKRLYKKQTEG
ncbi:hypothetical protein GCM10011533_01890 [Streptosporangium jomthongense]|uniref:Uncharacterized protein n=1 Tax=Marinobacter aromaticivorans TaxID=1494078 RepID=A0ABW2IQS7_9GAMM|nr:hypothetical protein [Marinobacter aromaticivorans]GGE53085.1 hypothetical protein GCM10011533_01890 [Streptosporangium jomthongense]